MRLELWWSGTYPLATVLPALLIIHSFIGVGEALITGTVVAFLLSVKPSMLYALRHEEYRPAATWQLAAAGLGVALFVAFCVSPLASAAPDGLEHVAEQLGAVEQPPAPALVPLPDYQVTALGGLWIATNVAGVIGTVVVFAPGLGAIARRAWPHPSAAQFRTRVVIARAIRLSQIPGDRDSQGHAT